MNPKETKLSSADLSMPVTISHSYKFFSIVGAYWALKRIPASMDDRAIT
ncbi:hypothetical protein [Photorhabdus noenieputensis]|nr:hypothetical protein [Photorhabdus noenieputensis]MCK3668055.1 hypothetical protein [Photorhabdus noenieputensis]